MKLLTGKRIGQSGGELTAAVFFSFLIHIIGLAGFLFLYTQGPPRRIVPPFYRVNLVNVPPGESPAPSLEQQPSSPPPEPAAKPMVPKAVPRAKAQVSIPATAAPKEAMPELDAKKAVTPEQNGEASAARPAETGSRQPAGAAVAVASTTQEFQFPPYVAIVRDKVERNWSPPPGIKGAQVKVTFKVLRSGRVGEARLEESSGNFYFDQAAMRAILASSPFPQLPEEFFKEYAVFSVDLMEKE